MTIKSICLVGLLLAVQLFGNEISREIRKGKVSFISSQNIYIQFDSTAGIKEGDNLFRISGKDTIAVVSIKYISSKSCAGTRLTGKDIRVDDELFAMVFRFIPREIEKKTETAPVSQISKVEIKFDTHEHIQKINGRFDIQSLSSFTNMSTYADIQRWRYTFSMDALNISGSHFSMFAYTNFAYSVKDWKNVKSNLFNYLHVYDLSTSYEIDSSSKIWAGRHLNYHAANVGSIDGLQYEATSKKMSYGIIAGSRPDNNNYGFNGKLFEYGGYIGRNDSVLNSFMENSIGAFQQTYKMKTDRRFLYLQHTNDFLPLTNFFVSSELELYKVSKGVGSSSLSMSSIYFSINSSPIQMLSLSLSYDARRNVFYYETYKTFIDSVLQNELRQGWRAGITLRPASGFSIGVDGSYRFEKSDAKPTRSAGGNIFYSNIPLIDASSIANYSYISSAYSRGTAFSERLSRSIFIEQLQLSVEYRNLKYKFVSIAEPLNQNIISADLSVALQSRFYLTASYEGVFESKTTYGRIFIDLSKRF